MERRNIGRTKWASSEPCSPSAFHRQILSLQDRRHPSPEPTGAVPDAQYWAGAAGSAGWPAPPRAVSSAAPAAGWAAPAGTPPPRATPLQAPACPCNARLARPSRTWPNAGSKRCHRAPKRSRGGGSRLAGASMARRAVREVRGGRCRHPGRPRKPLCGTAALAAKSA
eukprot:scaffold19149_cov146-Isochrysis_galbana.AAC.2